MSVHADTPLSLHLHPDTISWASAVSTAACAQQMASVCDLSVETGREEVSQGCRQGGVLTQRRELEGAQPGLPLTPGLPWAVHHPTQRLGFSLLPPTLGRLLA